MSLAVLVITNPALWTGALALAVPLLVHLLTRRSRVRVVFPSLRFLARARASQSRLYRLRHWLMFLLRTAAVALLLLAFLKPVLRSDPRPRAADPASPAAAVIVLDASASMGYQAIGSTLFSRAKIAALNVLDGLDARDAANLVVAGARPVTSLKEPSARKHHLKADVGNAALSCERADMDAAIAEAVRQLRMAREARRDLYLVSDFQRSNWAAVNFARIPREDIRVVFVPAGEDEPLNASVTEVTVHPPLPVVNEDVDVVCRIANAQPQPLELPVELRVGDEVHTRRATVPARTTATETFRLRMRRRDLLEGAVSIPGDRLPVDDTRYFTLPVADRVNVLIVGDEPPDAPGSAARLLAAATDPFGGGRDAVFAVSRCRSDALPPLSAALQHVVVTAATRAFPDAAYEALLAYLRTGGSAVFFLVSADDAANLRGLAERSAGALVLPFEPQAPVQQNATLAEANFDDPILRKFRDVSALADIHFTRCFGTERAKGQGRILARFDTGPAALALQTVGAGAVLVANFSPAPQHSDLARRALFVPLLHEMLKGVRPRRGQAESFLAGGACSATVRAWDRNSPLRFATPQGLEAAALFDVRHDETVVLFPETRETGFYRVFSGADRVGSAAVNVDTRESDLTPLTAEQLAALAKRPEHPFMAARAATAAAVNDLRDGRPIWYLLLLGAFLCLVVEQAAWLAWRN